MSWFGPMAARRDAVARVFGLDPAAIVGRSRKRHVVRARQAAAFVLRARHPDASLQSIGKVLGVKDHSSVRWAIGVAREYRRRDADFRQATDELIAQDIPAPLPVKLAERLQAAVARKPLRITRQTGTRRQFFADIRAYDEPRPHLLGIQLKGQPGCPRLSADEILARRHAVVTARRAREMALLEAERVRYCLPHRAMPLSEMAL